jgi:hypothetical protein
MKTVLAVVALAVGINLVGVTATAHADTLLVNRVKKTEGSAMPRRGLLKNQVEAQFGAPSKKHAAVGRPPITRWDYPAFSVYFEHNHVIDAVAMRASANEMGVKPAE